MHEQDPQAERYVKICNRLAQHGELSLTAIGLSTHIQSLPTGAPVSIKALSARFSEGETRIAAALRELEAHGYLSRTRERLPSGQIITRTVSYNVPLALRTTSPAQAGAAAPLVPLPAPGPGPVPLPGRVTVPKPAAAPVAVVAPVAAPPPAAAPVAVPAAAAPAPAVASDADPDDDPDPDHGPDHDPDPDPGPGAGLDPGPAPAAGPGLGSGPGPDPGTGPAPASPAAPTAPTGPAARRADAASRSAFASLAVPAGPVPEEHREAAELLARLRLRDPRLMLSERDVARLAPGLTGWLKLGLSPVAVGATLAGCLPDGAIRSPAALLAYRIRELRPPRLLERPAGVRPPQDRVILPFQTCDDCERAFRAASPGDCADCTATKAAKAA